MNELKPCPFCGGKPYTRFSLRSMGHQSDSVGFRVECFKCGISKGVILKVCDASFDDIEKAKNEAIEAWNRRVSE